MGWVRVQHGFGIDPFFLQKPWKIQKMWNKTVLSPCQTPSGNAKTRSAVLAWHFSILQGYSTSCFELDNCRHWGGPCDATQWGPLFPVSQMFPMPVGSRLEAPASQGNASSCPPASRRMLLQKAAGRPWAGLSDSKVKSKFGGLFKVQVDLSNVRIYIDS